MAEKMGVDTTTVGNWEAGKRQMTLEIDAVQEPIYGFPPVLAYSLYGAGEPLTRIEVEYRSTVWVEPITLDIELSVELRGWYHLYGNAWCKASLSSLLS